MKKFCFIFLFFLSCVSTQKNISLNHSEKIIINEKKIINPKISRFIFGINLNARENRFYSPVLAKYLKQWCEIIRWNSGAYSENYDWYYNSFNGKLSDDKSNFFNVWRFFKTHIQSNIQFILTANTMMEVNKLHSNLLSRYNKEKFDGAEHAGNWVKYCNQSNVKKIGRNPAHSSPFNIRFWEIGNEDNMLYSRKLKFSKDESWEMYSKIFRKYGESMIQADSNILLMGPVSTQRFHDNMGKFLKQNGDLVDIVTFHRYPKGKAEYKTMQGQLENIDDYDAYFQSVWKMIKKNTVNTKRRSKKDIKITITEYNAGSRKVCNPSEWAHALWIANMIGVLIKNNVYVANYWHGNMGSSATEFHHGLYDYTKGYKPFPAHYAFVFMHKHLHLDEHSQLVETQTSHSNLSSYAIKYDKGISLIIINKDAKRKIPIKIQLERPVKKMIVSVLVAPGKEQRKIIKVHSDIVEVKLAKYSVTAIDFE